MRYKETIDKKELLEIPISGFDGKIVLIDTAEDLKKNIPFLWKTDMLGFDTETRPAFKKGIIYNVSLLQLSTEDTAYLIRLNKTGLSAELAEILASDSIKKLGVAVHDDIKALKSLFQFKESAFIELQEYVRAFGIQDSGLAKLSAIILGFRISKRQQVTNWESEKLSPGQLKYAATDAWVCYKIYKELRNNNLVQKDERQDTAHIKIR